MIYLYHCSTCKKYFDVVKSTEEHRRIETCEICGRELHRIFSAPLIAITKTNWPEYNPAFGKVMNKSEVDYEVKRRNLVEVGTEDLNKYDIKLEKEAEARRKAEWDNLVTETYKET